MTDAGADYREAKDSVATHLVKQATAELAHVMNPTSETDAAVQKAVADVQWCLGLVIACGEAVKGVKFEDVPNLTPIEVQTKVGGKIQKAMTAERKTELAEVEKVKK